MRSTFKTMTLTMLWVSLFAALAVTAVYRMTAQPIADAQAENKAAALRLVLPGFDNNPLKSPLTLTVDGREAIVYTATRKRKTVGYAVQSSTGSGFSGDIVILAGFTPSGDIIGIEVLEHRETPGLGDRIETGKSEFPEQFRGVNPATFNLSLRVDGGDVDGITSATITTNAYLDAVNRAVAAFQTLQK